MFGAQKIPDITPWSEVVDLLACIGAAVLLGLISYPIASLLFAWVQARRAKLRDRSTDQSALPRVST